MEIVSPFMLDYIQGEEWTGKEGLRDDGLYYSYPDPVGNDTIGPGIKNINNLQGLTRDQLMSEFQQQVQSRLNDVIAIVNPTICNELSTPQKTALVSWYYNTGRKNSDFWKYVNSKDWTGLDNFWRNNYETADGVYIEGLDERRNSEADLFKSKAVGYIEMTKKFIFRNPIPFIGISAALVGVGLYLVFSNSKSK